MKGKSESEVTQSCPTIRDPMDCSLSGSSAHGIFQAKSTGVGCNFLLPFLCFSQFSSVAQSCPTLCDPWIAARQASLSITNSWSLPKLMSIESVMPSSHLILRCPLFLPSIFPSIRVFSNESALHIRWPKYWGFSFNISPSSEHPGLISFRMDWSDLLAV